MGCDEPHEFGRKPPGGKVSRHANRDVAGIFFAQPGNGPVDVLKCHLRGGSEFHTLFGECNASMAALKNLEAQVAFQPVDLIADGAFS